MPEMNTDALILEAIRKKILRDLEKEQAPSNVINNILGGGVSPGKGGGIFDQLGNASAGSGDDTDPGKFDYYVDIDKEDVPGVTDEELQALKNFLEQNKADLAGINPDLLDKIPTGKAGWKKKVHRYRVPLGGEPPKKKE